MSPLASAHGGRGRVYGALSGTTHTHRHTLARSLYFMKACYDDVLKNYCDLVIHQHAKVCVTRRKRESWQLCVNLAIKKLMALKWVCVNAVNNALN